MPPARPVSVRHRRPALPGFFGRILCGWGSASPTCGTCERTSPARCHGEESVFPIGKENLKKHGEHPPPPRRQPLPAGSRFAVAGPARHSPARRRAPWRGCGFCPSAGSPGRRDRPRSGGGSRRLPGRRPAATAAPAPRRHLRGARRRRGARGVGGTPGPAWPPPPRSFPPRPPLSPARPAARARAIAPASPLHAAQRSG